ncbi:hypothetical protein [Alicyclobacillus herbarius]|uniref:hypothetical protein n=1 Tax=Alicyclobacillus herbarius TaxID=122960 RepID=UPI000405C5C9|nr:hypothetical protein [Alicyclobacillus herbarius]
MSTLLGHAGMLVALQVVLALIAIRILVIGAMDLRQSVNWPNLAQAVTRPILLDALPLILLSWLTIVDPTHIIMRAWYYVAAALIVIRTLQDLLRRVRS